MLGFITFWFFFCFVKFECGGMFALCLKQSVLFLTDPTWAFSWMFCRRFTAVWILVLIHFCGLFIAGACSEIRYSSTLCFVETTCLTFVAIQLTVCHEMRDLGEGNLGTDSRNSFAVFSLFFYSFYFTWMKLVSWYYLSKFETNFLNDIY